MHNVCPWVDFEDSLRGYAPSIGVGCCSHSEVKIQCSTSRSCYPELIGANTLSLASREGSIFIEGLLGAYRKGHSNSDCSVYFGKET